jgi:UTP--glucose-1-phosphate uridylyltransferase
MGNEEHEEQDEDHEEGHRRLQGCEIHEMVPVAVVWRWAILILAGFCVVFTLDLVFDIAKSKLLRGITRKPAPASDEEGKTVKKIDAAEPAVANTGGAHRMLFAIMIGDAMHNFVDGISIGTAFLFCSPAVGWTVVAGSIAHEVSSEISDFLLLSNVCGLRAWQALALNFLSGMTIYFGVIAVLASDLDPAAAGMLLAGGGGLFIYNGAAECLPRVCNASELGTKFKGFVLFAVGAAAIGLVLMDHEHCETSH